MDKWCLKTYEAEHVAQEKWVHIGVKLLSKKLLEVP